MPDKEPGARRLTLEQHLRVVEAQILGIEEAVAIDRLVWKSRNEDDLAAALADEPFNLGDTVDVVLSQPVRARTPHRLCELRDERNEIIDKLTQYKVPASTAEATVAVQYRLTESERDVLLSIQGSSRRQPRYRHHAMDPRNLRRHDPRGSESLTSVVPQGRGVAAGCGRCGDPLTAGDRVDSARLTGGPDHQRTWTV